MDGSFKKGFDLVKEFVKDSSTNIKEQVSDSFSKGPIYFLKDYTAATLGSLIPSLPFIVYFEKHLPEILPFLEKMDLNSLNGGLKYFVGLNLATAYAVSKIKKGTRHGSKSDVKLKSSVGEKTTIHDAVFQGLPNLPVNLIVYSNISHGLVRTLGNAFTGVLDGISLDFFDVLMGTGDSKRIPNWIKNLDKKIRYGFVVGSIGLSSLVMKNAIDSPKYLSETENLKVDSKEIFLGDLERKVGSYDFIKVEETKADGSLSYKTNNLLKEGNFYSE